MAVTALDRDDPRLGLVLRDKYRIEGVIGVGGMATVYLAVHRNGNRVALKMLHPQLSGPGVHRERFVRESYVANSLDHPGTVRVLDDDVSEDGCPFLVMELLQGETLEARYRRMGRLAAREVLALGHALCDVLARAHAIGVVHRDIKPENIFLTARGELKVLDFGIAHVRQEGRESGTRTGHLMGTPSYMPPEQALGRRHAIDGRTDLWSLAATMFALLAGRPVHPCDTPEETVVRAATIPAPPLASVAPDVPAPIAAVIDRALAFASDDRWPDAASMQAALAAAHRELFDVDISASELPRGPAATTTLPVRPHGAAATFNAATLASDPGRALTISDAAMNTLSQLDESSLAERSLAERSLAERSLAERSLGEAPAPRPRDFSLSDATLDSSLERVHASPAPSLPPTPALPLPALHIAPQQLPGTVADAPSPALAISSPSPSPPLAPPSRRTRTLAILGALAALGLAVPFAAGALDDAGACTTNAACTADVPTICRKDQRRCVPLLTEGCRLFADDAAIASDDTFWFGAMYPLRDQTMAYGAEAARWVELAHRDFTGLAGGLPSTRPGGRTRPLGVILCDDTEDHARLATHLVDVVGVPAVIGFGRSKEVLELAGSHFIPRGVLALASNTASMIASIPHPPGEPRLVHRVTTSADMIAPAKAALVRALEPDLRAGPLGADGTLRIAVFRSANASGTSHTDAFYNALAATRPPGAREEIRQFVLPDVMTDDPAVLRQPVADVTAFAPHAILDAGAPGYVAAVERAWTSDTGPYYLHSGIDPGELRAAAAVRPDFHTRFLQVATRTNTTLDKVRDHYLAHFGGSASGLSPTPYDAFYTLAYAAIAVGDQQPADGRALARALRRLVAPGEPIEIGPAGIYPALKILAAGGTIDLRGTLTDLDFDPETGDPHADFALHCLGPGSDGDLIETPTHYDARLGAFVGPARCP